MGGNEIIESLPLIATHVKIDSTILSTVLPPSQTLLCSKPSPPLAGLARNLGSHRGQSGSEATVATHMPTKPLQAQRQVVSGPSSTPLC